MENWDIICVGAGISSLAFAAQLTKRRPELKILVVDKHSVPGGYASVFKRKNSRFDCSLHKMSGIHPGGNLRNSLLELGILNEMKFIPVRDLFGFHIKGHAHYQKLSSNAQELKQSLTHAFPNEAEALGQFFNEVEVHGGNGYYQFQILEGTHAVSVEDLRFARKHLKPITVSRALEERFKSPLLRELLGLVTIYSGGFPEDLSYLYYLHLFYAVVYIGTSYVEGSSQHLSNQLVKVIEENGNKVRLKTTVTKILIGEDGKARGIETSAGTYYAPEILINASPHYAVDNFFEDQSALQETKARLSNLLPTYATSTVYFLTDVPPEELGLLSSETILFSEHYADATSFRKSALKERSNHELMEAAFWKYSPAEVTNYHLLDPNGGRVVVLNVLDLVDHWPARGTEEYERKKDRLTEILMARIYDACPKLKGHITYIETSSPRTYERYTNNTGGAGYGAMIGPDQSAHTFHKNFPYRGIHFLSAWVAGASYEAAFGAARLKAMTFN